MIEIIKALTEDNWTPTSLLTSAMGLNMVFCISANSLTAVLKKVRYFATNGVP